MIRTDTLTDYSGIDALSAFVAAYPDIVQDTVETVVNRHRPQFLQELRHAPARPKYPIAWTSERQRKAVMAKLRRENNLPYRRTGKLSAGWQIRVIRGDYAATVNVENAVDYAAFVVGKLRPAGDDWQQRFHRNSGWPRASETIDFWSNALAKEVTQELTRYTG